MTDAKAHTFGLKTKSGNNLKRQVLWGIAVVFAVAALILLSSSYFARKEKRANLLGRYFVKIPALAD